MQEADIQTLAQAFIEKANECGIKLFPETAEGLAREVFEEYSNDTIIPIDALVKEKFNNICGKNVKSSAEVIGLHRLSNSINKLLLKISQATNSGPLTPQEIEEWRKRIIDDVYVPFQNIGLEVAAKARELMAKLEKVSKEHYDLEKLYKSKVKTSSDAFQEMVEADKNNQAAPSYHNKNVYLQKKQKYNSLNDGLMATAEAIINKKYEMNSIQSVLIYLTGTSDYIKETIKVPENFGAKLDGATGYLKEMEIAIDEILNIVNSIKYGKARIDILHLDPQDPKRRELPHWLLKGMANNLKNNPIDFQVASIGPSIDSINVDDFEKASWASVGQRNVLWEKITRQYSNLSHDEQRQKYSEELAKLKEQNKKVFEEINKLPNTWKKFRDIYAILDPISKKQFSDMHSANLETPEGWGASATEQQAGAPTQEQIEEKDSALSYLKKKNPRAWGLIRKLSETQNPNAHWGILFTLSSLSDIGYDTESGKTYGEEFLSDLPEEKRKDPDMIAKAKKIDGELREKRKEIALQVIFNPGTPDWILMKMASLGYRYVGADDAIQKKMDEDYDFIRKVAYEMLQKRGWKLKRDDKGNPISHKLGPLEVGFEFEKKNTTASSKSGIKTAQQNSALQQLQSQMESLDRQLNGLEKQMSDLRNRKGQLQRQISAEQERIGQIEQANEKAKAQQAMSDAAQPASNQAPAAGIGTSAMGAQ